jgi:hypothetical protein
MSDTPPVLAKTPKAKPSKNFWGVLIGVAVGVLCEIGGYLLMRGDQQEYGSVIFILVPFVTGVVITIFTPQGTRILACVVGTVLLCLSVLIFTGLEGYICCFMALPLVLVGVGLGALIGLGVKERFIKEKKNSAQIKMLLLVFMATFLVAAKNVEMPLIKNPRYETFEQSVTLPVLPDKAWNLVKSMNRLEATKPFLLKIGLPIPQSCEVDEEAVGGNRVCYFNSGMISQKITEWDFPKSMKVDVIKSTLPGRHWLKFIDAGYDFIPNGNKTIVVRKTTISSHLYPRWYWRPFEEWGVQSEHKYVLSDVLRRAQLSPDN